MFTGIIMGTGRIISIEEKGGDLELGIDAAVLDLPRSSVGDSAAFYADVSRETISTTTLGSLARGARVNLEPSLRAGDALGGHMVSGHVDAVGRLTAEHQEGRSWRMEFELPAALMRFVAPKGSICIDGVSLTVNQVGGRRFDVNIIPHTREVTTLGELVVDAGVNIEIDVIARYLERLMLKTEE
jgi:riboflavin synthase